MRREATQGYSSCTQARQNGFQAYQLNAQDDDWAEKIIQRAKEISEREQREQKQ